MCLSSVNASLGTFKQNDCVEIKTILNSTYVNISSVTYPNYTSFIDDSMSKNGMTFNYTFCNTSQIGEYIYDYYDESGNVYVNDFKVSQTGSVLSTSQGIIYLVFFVILIFAFIGCMFGALRIPWKHTRDDSDRIISVNDTRYFKIVFYFFAYILLLFIFGLARAMTHEFLYLQGASNVFNWVYWIMLPLTFPIIVVALIIALANFANSTKLKKAIIRGVPLR